MSVSSVCAAAARLVYVGRFIRDTARYMDEQEDAVQEALAQHGVHANHARHVYCANKQQCCSLADAVQLIADAIRTWKQPPNTELSSELQQLQATLDRTRVLVLSLVMPVSLR